jgi:hypothetical protein
MKQARRKSEWLTDLDFLRRHCTEQGFEMSSAYYERNRQLKAQKEIWLAESASWNTGFVLTFNGTLGLKGLRLDNKADEEAQRAVRKFWNILDRQRFGKSNVANGKRYKRIGTIEKGKTGTNRHWNYIIDTDGESVKLFNARAKDTWETRLAMGQLYVIADAGISWGSYSTKEITALSSDALDLETTHL